MRLDEYLKALEECPDEIAKIEKDKKKQKLHRLTSELGVYDNWPIFLKTDFKKFVEHLQNSNYIRGETLIDGPKKDYQFFYKPGTVELQVMDYVPIGVATGEYTNEGKIHFLRQKEEFNMGVVLHPYPDTKIEGLGWQRAIALVIGDISYYAQKENIALCFPNSIGWSDPYNYSRIVYYDPVKAKETSSGLNGRDRRENPEAGLGIFDHWAKDD
jgi:hypothetical protein